LYNIKYNLMNIKPLILDLTYNNKTNDDYYPGKYGARKQIDINLKKFIPLKRFFLRKRPNLFIKNNDTKSRRVKNH